MTISINQTPIYSSVVQKSAPKTEDKKSTTTSKVVLGGLAALGITAAVYLALRKKSSAANKVKGITGKDPKVEKLTDAEKEKLIKELQAKTDDPDVKAEIRKLVENGEWDKLP